MLTEKHLALVRAALKFFDEEMSPSGTNALLPYLDDQGKAANVDISDVAQTRNFFDSVDMGYVLVDSTGILVESQRLIPASPSVALNFQSDLSLLAVVLIPAL